MIYGGIDAGSRTIKAVIIDGDSTEIIASGITDQGVKQDSLAEALFNDIAGSDRGKIKRIVATGYGRDALPMADTTITEITCHAHGVHHLAPHARTVIDIGGQDSKVLRLQNDGRVRDFAMNDRCAAGTGRFLEIVADRLGIELDSLGEAAGNATAPSSISTMCVVFAETEIIGLLAAGESPENIVAGVQQSIVGRIATMGGRQIMDPVIFTGGVAMVSGMPEALSSAVGHAVTVVPHPQLTGALGAALLAVDSSDH